MTLENNTEKSSRMFQSKTSASQSNRTKIHLNNCKAQVATNENLTNGMTTSEPQLIVVRQNGSTTREQGRQHFETFLEAISQRNNMQARTGTTQKSEDVIVTPIVLDIGTHVSKLNSTFSNAAKLRKLSKYRSSLLTKKDFEYIEEKIDGHYKSTLTNSQNTTHSREYTAFYFTQALYYAYENGQHYKTHGLLDKLKENLEVSDVCVSSSAAIALCHLLEHTEQGDHIMKRILEILNGSDRDKIMNFKGSLPHDECEVPTLPNAPVAHSSFTYLLNNTLTMFNANLLCFYYIEMRTSAVIALHSAARNGVKLTPEIVTALEKAVHYVEDTPDFFFCKVNGDHRERRRGKGRRSDSLQNSSKNGELLLDEDFDYLVKHVRNYPKEVYTLYYAAALNCQQIPDKAVNALEDLVQYNCETISSYASLALCYVTKKNFEIPSRALTIVEKRLQTEGYSKKWAASLFSKYEAILALGEVVRNYDKSVWDKILPSINQVFDKMRENAAYVLGYHIANADGDNHLSNITIQQLKKLSDDKNESVSKAAKFANNIRSIKDFGQFNNYEEMEKKLQDKRLSASASQFFENEAKRGRWLGSTVIGKLGKILKDNHPIETQRIAASAMRYCAENREGLTPEIFSYLNTAQQSKDDILVNCIISMLSFYATKISTAGEIQPTVDFLNEKLLVESCRANAILALGNILQNQIDVPETLKSAFKNVFRSLEYFLSTDKNNFEIRQNAALALAHAAKNNHVLETSILESVGNLLANTDENEEIRKTAITILAYAAESNECKIEDFPESALKVLISCLSDKNEDISNYSRATLEFFVENHKCLSEAVLDELVSRLQKIESASSAYQVLIKVVESINLTDDIVNKISNETYKQFDTVKRINAAQLLDKMSQKHRVSERYLGKLESVLNEEQEEKLIEYVVSSLNNILGFYCREEERFKSDLNEKTCIKLAEILSDYSNDIELRKNACSTLSYAARLQQQLFENVVTILEQRLKDDNTEISKMCIQTLRYYIERTCNSNTPSPSLVSTLENVLGNSLLIEDAVYALCSIAVQHVNFTDKTLRVFSDLLLESPKKPLREHAKSLLEKIRDARKDETFPLIISDILKLEGYGSDLQNETLSNEKRLNAANNLLIATKDGHQFLTLNNFDSLMNAILNSKINSDISRSIITCLESVVKNAQILPNTIITLLGKTLNDDDDDSKDAKTDILSILSEAARNGQFISTDVINAVKELVNKPAVNESVNKDAVFILRIASQRNEILDNQTLEKLSALLRRNDLELEIKKNITATILFSADVSVLPEGIVSNLLEALDCSDNPNNAEINESIVHFLKKIVRDTKNQPLFECLYTPNNVLKYLSILQKYDQIQVQDSFVKDSLLALLKQIKVQISNPELQKEVDALIGVEPDENVLKDLKEKLNKSDVKTKTSALNELKQMESKVPSSILDSIGSYIFDFSMSDDDGLSFGRLASDTLLKIIKTNQNLSENVVENLIRALYEHPDDFVRENALLILKYIAEHQSSQEICDKINPLIAMENNCTMKDLSLHEYSKFERLTYNCLKALHLKLGMKQMNSVSQSNDILHYFSRQSALPSSLISSILTNLVHQLNELDEKNAVDTIIEIVDKNRINSNDINCITQILYTQLSKSNCKSSTIKIIQHLAYREILPQDTNILGSLETDEVLLKLGSIIEEGRDDDEKQYNTIYTLGYLANSKRKLPEVVIKALEEVSQRTQDSLILSKIARIFGYIHRDTEKHPHDLIYFPSKILDDKLKNFVEQENKEKVINGLKKLSYSQSLITFSTLLSSKTKDFQTLSDYPPEMWSRELLCNELLCNMDIIKQRDEVEKFYLNLYVFEESLNFKMYSEKRDRILELLIEKKIKHQLTLAQINELLIILKLGYNYAIDWLTPEMRDDWVKNIKYLWLFTSFKKLLDEQVFISEISSIAQLLLSDSGTPWSIDAIDKLLKNLRHMQGLEGIINFLKFIEENKVDRWKVNDILKLDLVHHKVNNIRRWQDLIAKDLLYEQLKHLEDGYGCVGVGPKFYSSSHPHLNPCSVLVDKAIKLLDAHWSLQYVNTLMDKLLKDQNISQNLENVGKMFSVLYEYRLTIDDIKEIQFDSINSTLWVDKVHKKAIYKHFDLKHNEKDLDTLLKEIEENNYTNESFSSLLNNERLRNKFYNVMKAYNKKSTLCKNEEKIIKDWSEDNISSWTKEIRKQDKNSNSVEEILAVIKRAIYLSYEFEPRTIQIIAVLIMLEKSNEEGLLAQIATGEGKSITIVILATIKALQGELVDIVTSSPLLAKRDAEKHAKFYNLFDLKVSENSDDYYNYDGLKKCYADDIQIVYGDASNFQFDILREEYSLLGTRGCRSFNTVIIDEVDSLLIDNSSKIAMLANNIPGIDNLEPILFDIWQHLERIDRGFLFLNGELHWTSKEFELIDGVVNFINNYVNTETKILHVTNPYEFTFDQIKTFIEKRISISKEDLKEEVNGFVKDELGIPYSLIANIELVKEQIAQEIDKDNEMFYHSDDSVNINNGKITEHVEKVEQIKGHSKTKFICDYIKKSIQSIPIDDKDNPLIKVFSELKDFLEKEKVEDDNIKSTIHKELDRLTKLENIELVKSKIYEIDKKFCNLDGKLYWRKNDNCEMTSKDNLIEVKDRSQFIVDRLKEYCKNKENSQNNELKRLSKYLIDRLPKITPRRPLPNHLRDFVMTQLPKWIENAIAAKRVYKEGQHYIIVKDINGVQSITPVDFENTGIIQKCTTWGNGLHQFLQIKHQLKITSENLTTNFLSNMEYFSRYIERDKANSIVSNKIYGVTGTLGSREAQQLLEKVYSVNFAKIPCFKPKKFLELSGIIAESEEEWMKEIRTHVVQEITAKRAVLVICETIAQAEKVHKELREEYKDKVRLYTRSDNDERGAVSTIVEAREIIVATNLAGRGTDIHISKTIEENGGLHVCVTFLPSNLRVEEQAFGRTARQGQCGTAQLILNRESIRKRLGSCNEIRHVEEIKKLRDQVETAYLNRFKNQELEQIRTKDKLFTKFCDLLKEIRVNDNSSSSLSSSMERFNISAKYYVEQTHRKYQLESVVERWGIWLKGVDQEPISQNRPADFGFKCHDVTRDGNCFYYALEHQLTQQEFNVPNRVNDHHYLKQIALEHIETQKLLYDKFTGDWQSFIERHKEKNAWADEIIIQALSRVLNMNIIIVRDDGSEPNIFRRKEALYSVFLFYQNQAHYLSLLPSADLIGRQDINKYINKADIDLIDVAPITLTRSKPDSVTNKFLPRSERDRPLNIWDKFKDFREQILRDYKDNQVIKNPYYRIAFGNDLIAYANSWKSMGARIIEVVHKTSNFYEEAIKEFDKAAELDPIYAYNARYNKAYATIRRGFELVTQNQNIETSSHRSFVTGPYEYKENAKQDMLNAAETINNHIMPQLIGMQIGLSLSKIKVGSSSNDYTDLDRQLINKIDMIQLQLNSIQQAIHAIERSQKLIDITIHETESDRASISCSNRNSCESISFIKLTKTDALKQVTTNGKTFIAGFRDLIVSRDMNVTIQDQPSKTIQKGSESCKIDIIFEKMNWKKIMELLSLTSSKDCKDEVNTIGAIGKTISETAKLAEGLADGKRLLNITAHEWSTEEVFKEIEGDLKSVQDHCNIDLVFHNIDKAGLCKIDQKDTFKQRLGTTIVTFSDAASKKHVRLMWTKAIERVKENKEIPFSIIFTKLRKTDMKQLIQDVSGVVYDVGPEDTYLRANSLRIDVIFNGISYREATDLAGKIKATFTLNFFDLTKTQAKWIVHTKKKHIVDSIINFKDLTCKDAQDIISNADRSEEGFNIDLKPIGKIFLTYHPMRTELEEFKCNGLRWLFDLHEKGPIPKVTMITVALLGFAQLGGAVLLYLQLGAVSDLAIQLTLGGIGDLFSLIKIARSRNFDWKNYWSWKAVDYTIFIAKEGWTALTEVEKTANVGTKGAQLSKIVLENIGEECVMSGIHKVVDKRKTLEKIILNWMNITDEIIKDVYPVNIPSSCRLSDIRLSISEYIKQEIKSILYKFPADKSINSKDLQNHIEQIAQKVISSIHYQYIEAATSIVNEILDKKIEDSSKSKHPFDIALVPGKLANIKKTFNDKFTRELEELEKHLTCPKVPDQQHNKKVIVQSPDIPHGPLGNNTSLNTESTERQGNQNKDSEKVKYSTNIPKSCSDIDKYSTETDDGFALDELCEKISYMMVDQIWIAIQGQIERLIANHATNSPIRSHLETEWINPIRYQRMDLQGKRSYYTIDEEALDTHLHDTAKQTSLKLKTHIKSITSKGGYNILLLKALSESICRPIEVYIDCKRYYTVGDELKEESIKLAYTKPTTNSEGHWDNMGGNVHQASSKNYLFDAAASQTEHNADELLQRTANEMLDKIDTYVKLMPAIDRLLSSGGATRKLE
ncbi:unnamed protein product, partial [Rotaria socialis]